MASDFEYKDKYQNGYKSGYSAADDPERKNYSPLAVDGQLRDALAGSYEREREMAEYQRGLEKEKRYYEKIAQQQQREADRFAQIEREGREQVAQRRAAINLIVSQKRDEYNKKSWFGKAVATMMRKSFSQRKKEIIEAAERRVDRMTPEQMENFVEREGRRR